jgi:hypothetical protein
MAAELIDFRPGEGRQPFKELFLRLKSATLIQERTQMRNIDSNLRSIGFEYCALTARRRVLQHIPATSRHPCAISAGPLGATSEHPANTKLSAS